jgi:hypothetical protein
MVSSKQRPFRNLGADTPNDAERLCNRSLEVTRCE